MKDVKDVMHTNEKIFDENKHFRTDIEAIAVVTSCLAEFVSMQTALD